MIDPTISTISQMETYDRQRSAKEWTYYLIPLVIVPTSPVSWIKLSCFSIKSIEIDLEINLSSVFAACEVLEEH